MKKLTYLSTVVIAIALVFGSCKKEEHIESNEKPSLSIVKPSDKAVVKSNETIAIEGTVSDPSLHELVIKLTNTKTGSDVLFEAPIVHDLKTYTFNYSYTPSVSTSTNFILEVIVINHSEIKNSETRTITVNP